MTAPIDVTHLPTHYDLPPPLQRTTTPPDMVGTELMDLIQTRIRNHPRTLQQEIGPSEIGHPCARRIGYTLNGHPEREGLVNWKATVGTAIHTWMEELLDLDNLDYAEAHNGQERWYVETKVNTGDINGTDIWGSCDVFDRVTGTVIDWKTCGPTMLRKYVKNGPGDAYRIQAHLYGRGWQRKGLDVRNVMIIFLPRQGELLRDSHIWHEPYDVHVALHALQRATGIDLTLAQLGDDALPLLPTADAYCSHCPFFLAGSQDPRIGCPGHPREQQDRKPALELI